MTALRGQNDNIARGDLFQSVTSNGNETRLTKQGFYSGDFYKTLFPFYGGGVRSMDLPRIADAAAYAGEPASSWKGQSLKSESFLRDFFRK